jgi:hypothetical protein
VSAFLAYQQEEAVRKSNVKLKETKVSKFDGRARTASSRSNYSYKSRAMTK